MLEGVYLYDNVKEHVESCCILQWSDQIQFSRASELTFLCTMLFCVIDKLYNIGKQSEPT